MEDERFLHFNNWNVVDGPQTRELSEWAAVIVWKSRIMDWIKSQDPEQWQTVPEGGIFGTPDFYIHPKLLTMLVLTWEQ